MTTARRLLASLRAWLARWFGDVPLDDRTDRSDYTWP